MSGNRASRRVRGPLAASGGLPEALERAFSPKGWRVLGREGGRTRWPEPPSRWVAGDAGAGEPEPPDAA